MWENAGGNALATENITLDVQMRKVAIRACLGAMCLFWAGCANAKGGSPGWHAFHHWPLPPAQAMTPSVRQANSYNHHWAAPHSR